MGIRTRLELRLASPPLAIWQYRDVTLLYPSLRAHSISYCIHRQSTRHTIDPRFFASLECDFQLPSGDCSNNGCPCVLDHGSSIYVALVPHPRTHGLIHLFLWDVRTGLAVLAAVTVHLRASKHSAAALHSSPLFPPSSRIASWGRISSPDCRLNVFCSPSSLVTVSCFKFFQIPFTNFQKNFAPSQVPASSIKTLSRSYNNPHSLSAIIDAHVGGFRGCHSPIASLS